MVRETNHCAKVNGSDPMETRLFEAYARSRSVELRNEIVEKYLYIPSIVANRFSGRGVDTDDLYQVASLALIKAVERFTLERGVQFASFATPTIAGEVKNYFRDKMRAIRLPRRGAEAARQIFAARQALEQRLFRAPTPNELSEHTGLSIEEVLEAHEFASAMNAVSIDADVAGDFALEKVLGFDENGYEAFERKNTVEALLALLPGDERNVVIKRYFDGFSQRELANSLNVSQMTISRTERRALDKMKKAMLEE